MPNRDVVFVSHANPEDNVFARWLSLKLAGFGYRVWSDVTKLLGGEDFWQEIEPIIRDSTVKFLYVLSRTSNHKEGVLRELAVADAVRKTNSEIKDFIIPLRIDDLPHSAINIEVGRLNVIEFSDSWAMGLKQLCRRLEFDKVPRSASDGLDFVRKWWEAAYAADGGVSNTSEPHYSNWFSLRLPDRIYRYSMIGLVESEPKWPFPTKWHERRLTTFAPRPDVELGRVSLQIRQVEALDLSSFLTEDNGRHRDNRNIVLAMLAEAWEAFVSSKGLKRFDLASRRPAFYFDAETLPNSSVSFRSIRDTSTRRSLRGYKTRKSGERRHWHFAVSAWPAVHPRPMLQIRTHVLFSDDGRVIWSSPEAMHRARRSQCKNWWNDDWRDRLLATMSWLASGESTFALPLAVASVSSVVDARPVEFLCPVKLEENWSERSERESENEDGFDVE